MDMTTRKNQGASRHQRQQDTADGRANEKQQDARKAHDKDVAEEHGSVWRDGQEKVKAQSKTHGGYTKECFPSKYGQVGDQTEQELVTERFKDGEKKELHHVGQCSKRDDAEFKKVQDIRTEEGTEAVRGHPGGESPSLVHRMLHVEDITGILELIEVRFEPVTRFLLILPHSRKGTQATSLLFREDRGIFCQNVLSRVCSAIFFDAVHAQTFSCEEMYLDLFFIAHMNTKVL